MARIVDGLREGPSRPGHYYLFVEGKLVGFATVTHYPSAHSGISMVNRAYTRSNSRNVKFPEQWKAWATELRLFAENEGLSPESISYDAELPWELRHEIE